MNRPHNYADSAYFVHQRYEDTALVIFQQHAKEKKKANPGQYTPLSHPSSASPHSPTATPQHFDLPPGVGNAPGKTSSPEAASSPHPVTNSAGPRSPHWESSTRASSVVNSSAVHAAGGVASAISGATRSRANTNTSVTESEKSDLDSPVTQRRDAFDQKSVGSSGGSPVDPHHKPRHNTTSPGAQGVSRHDTTTNGVGVGEAHDDVRGKHTDVTRDGDVQNNTHPDGFSQPSGVHAGSSAKARVSVAASEVEVGHYGSSGVVARRKVGMSKSDSHRTQSRICTVM
eukprot:GHVL01004525.1.p1 GENE.GHVL01004525.1~~GHVL01004525.1.p1  ORF type:complete len:286 (-),score=24.95 GHVL01004525.1:762-1619(-)